MTKEYDSTIPANNSDDEAVLAPVQSKKKTDEHRFAKELHRLGWIYGLYGALDGISLSYSMVKYCFDLTCTFGSQISSDAMHNWMMTPTGFATSSVEAITIISFSLIANIYDNEENKNSFQKFITSVWPYMRDGMKGLKNGYKGVRGLAPIAGFLAGQDFTNLIVPVGVLLGALSMLNRMWYRKMKDDRKAFMKQNSLLLQNVKNADIMDEEMAAKFRCQIQRQLLGLRIKSLFSAAYGGVVDGLYLFMGSLGLVSLAPTVYMALSIFCIVFTVTCIATRLYEEYDYQRSLIVTQTKVELAICGKELESIFKALHKLSKPIYNQVISDLQKKQDALVLALEKKMQEFEKKREFLRSQLTLSYTSALFSGLRDGLAAYSAIASAIFAIATVYTIMLSTIPPALIIGSVLAGGVCLVGFMFNSLLVNYWHLREVEQKNQSRESTLAGLLKDIKDKSKEVQDLEPAEFSEALFGNMHVDASPQFHFQEGFEVARSLFSGVAKGQKSIDYMMNSWQEVDEQGHCHDTSFMAALTLISSTVYAGGLALRAYARGFGRPPIDEVSPVEERREPLDESFPDERETAERSSPGNSAKVTLPRSNSLEAMHDRRYQFFKAPSPSPRPVLNRSVSAGELSNLERSALDVTTLAPQLS
jgi:hypothetical protein